MTLLKVVSERKDKNGNAFIDLYLAWKHQEKYFAVRVKSCFPCDTSKLFAEAVECESLDNFQKYVD